MIDAANVIAAIRPGAEWTLHGLEIDWNGDNFIWHDTVQIKPTKEEFETAFAEMTAEYTSREYQRVRATQYPSIADQLDMLWHAMDTGALPRVDSFYSAIKAVKDANPKQ